MICMGQVLIPVGNSPNNEDGPLSLRDVFLLINSNMVWLAKNSGGGPTNGQTLSQVQATVANNAVAITNGVSTNQILLTPTLNGTVKITGPSANQLLFLSSGTKLLAGLPSSSTAGILENSGSSFPDFNPAPAFNGANVTNVTATIPDPLSLNTISTVNLHATNIVGNGIGLTNLAGQPASGHTNVVMEKADGSTIPFDLATLLSNGGGGGGPDTPWTVDHFAAQHSLWGLNVLNLTNTITGIGVFAVTSLDGPRAALNFSGTTNGTGSQLTVIADGFIADNIGGGASSTNIFGGANIFSNAITLLNTNVAPGTTTTPKLWFPVTNNGNMYLVPGYQ